MSRAICLPAPGIESPLALDPDGIPEWAQHPEHGYHHGDPRQLIFAFDCLDYGFHVPEFDRWLSARPQSSSKTQMLEHRAKAFQAFLANDAATMILHIQILDARQIASEAWPLARTGRKVTTGGEKGGRSRQRPAWHLDAIKHAKLLAGTGRESHELTSICARKFNKKEDATRKVLQDAGLVPRRKTRV